jgi:chemotaxis regulatin CheY-phosphate phosphatase CheZ
MVDSHQETQDLIQKIGSFLLANSKKLQGSFEYIQIINQIQKIQEHWGDERSRLNFSLAQRQPEQSILETDENYQKLSCDIKEKIDKKQMGT